MKTFLHLKYFLLALLTTSSLPMAQSQSLSYESYFDFSNGLTLNATTFSVAAQDGGPTGIEFSPDGMTMFVVGTVSDAVHQYSLSIAFDITSTVLLEGSFLVSGQDHVPLDVTFSPDGKTMFVLGNNTGSVYKYSVSTAFDITSTVTYTNDSFTFSGFEHDPYAVAFSNDGMKMWVGGSGRDIDQYELTSAFDITSVSFSPEGNTGGLTDYLVMDFQFSSDGSSLFVLDRALGNAHTINEYQLAVPFDVLSGMVKQPLNFKIGSEETFPYGFTFSAGGNRLYVVGYTGDDVNQYELKTPLISEGLANDGSITDIRKSFYLSDETFNNAGGVLDYDVHYTIDNLPAGLSPALSISSDGKSASLSFSGTANDHQFSNSVADLEFTFENSAFVGGNASAVSNAVAANSGIKIAFRDNTTPTLSYGNYGPISKAIPFENTLSVSGEDTSPEGMAFSKDGTKLFVVGTIGDKVYQYTLTTPFDVTSGASYSGYSYSVATNPTGIAFNSDGTTMLILGSTGNAVYQYSLSTGFDLNSTLAPVGSPFSVATQTTSPSGIAFNDDGTKMFISGSDIYEYSLSSSFDINSSVTYRSTFNIPSGAPVDVAFDQTGMALYTIFSNALYKYSLSAPYMISHGYDDGLLTFTNNFESSTRGIAFSADRSKLFLLGSSVDDITQLQLYADQFNESSSNNGAVDDALTIRIADDRFTHGGGTLTQGVDYTLTGMPSGLSPVLSVASDGLSASLSLSGSAIAHAAANSVSDLVFTFANSAFTSSDAADVLNAVGASSNYKISFEDPFALAYNAGAFDVSGDLNLSTSYFSLISYGTNTHGIAFSADGMKMFAVNSTDKEVNQFSLTQPFVTTSGVTSDGSPFSVSAQDVFPYGVQFSNDGHKMFVLGGSSDDVLQYSLSNAFDITSGASYDGIRFDISQESTTTTDLCFSADGKRMYVVTNANVFQYKLTKPFDLSGSATLESSFYIGGQEGDAQAVYVSPDGTKLMVLGKNGDKVFSYDLAEKFNVATATYNYKFISVSGVDSSPTGFTFSPTGSLFVVGSNYNRVGMFNLFSPDFSESAANQGGMDGSFSIGVIGDKFANAGSTLAHPTTFSLSEVPAGLTPMMTVSADGLTATLTFAESATSHQNSDNVENLELTLKNPALVSGVAASVLNYHFDLGAGINFNNNPQLTYVNGYNLTHGADFNDKFNISNNEGGPNGIAFSNDGMKMFVVGTGDDEINQYSLSTAFDITAGVSFDGIRSHADAAPSGIVFNNTGSKMYVVGYGGKAVYQHSLSTPFHVTSGVSNDGSFSVNAQDLTPQGLAISTNGDKLFVVGGVNKKIFQYSFNNPFDIAGGVTYDNVSYDVSAQDNSPTEVTFSPDGFKMFVIGLANDQVYQYSLTTPFNISSGVTYDNIALDVRAEEQTPYGFAFGKNGTRLFVVGTAGKEVNQYDLTVDGFKESAKNNGEVDGLQGIQLTYDTFVNAGSTLSENTHYSVTGLPEGLTPAISVGPGGTFATLTLSGKAPEHQDDDNIANLVISFTDGAFTTNPAAGIYNSTDESIEGIDFRDNSPYLVYGNQYDFENTTHAGNSASHETEDASMLGMAFNPSGTKVFLVGAEHDAIYQYSLTTPFDVSAGMTFDGSPFSVADKETIPTGLAFSNDGTKMFIVGGADDVIQYSLTTPFDITNGGSYVDSFDFFAKESGASGITFNNNGTKMYIIGSNDDEVNQFSLATPFDITSGVTFDGNPFYFGNYQNNPHGLAFSPGGNKLFVLGSSGDEVRQFDLENPYDITSGVSEPTRLSIGGEDTSPTDLVISPDGLRMFVIGASDNDVNQYDFKYSGFTEGSKNDGSLSGSQTILVVDDSFTNADGDLIQGTHFNVSNLPSGLTPVLAVAADGFSAELTFTGKATNHQNDDGLEGLQFTFNNAAFSGGNASIVTNAVAATTAFDLDFRNNLPAVFYGDVFDVSKAVSAGTPLDISSEDSYPSGIAFNSDGTKMFIAGGNNSLVLQYTLSTPYLITSGVSYSSSFNVSAEDEYPEDLAFSTDGTRMFVLGGDNYTVYQYNLTTPFDVTSGVAYSGHSVYVEDEDSSPYGLAFSPDGSKMYIGGGNNYAVIQYSVGNAFDLSSSVVFDGNPLITEEEDYSPTGLAFSPDGRFLLISEDSYYGIMLYRLTAPFDITQGATYEEYLDLDTDGVYPTAVATNPAGSRIFVAEGDNGSIVQYNIDLGGFTEAASNDGTVEGSMKLNMVDDTFTSPGGILAFESAFYITNLPDGLVPSFAVAADGYSATLTFSGKAEVHQDATDISGLIFTFNNSAFVNSNAANVDNAVTANSSIGIDFLINTENDILEFVLTDQVDVAEIDDDNHTVNMEVEAGTSLTSLAPTITLSDGATSDPVSGMSQNFTSAVNYTVTAEDGTEQVWEVTITEQQVAPTDILLSEITIDENNSVGDVIGTLSAVDGNTSQTHLYTFVAGEGDADNGSFQINDDALKADEVFDFETKSEYLIRVQTDDQNGGLFEKALVITINDVNEIPTDIALDNTTVDESNPVGTVVGTVFTTDEDNGQTHLYSLVAGTGDEGNSSFVIAGNQLKTAVVLDFEAQDTYSVRIETDDQNGGTLEEVFIISVNDLPAQVTSLTLDNQSVMENLEAGAVVGNLTTTGEDLSGSYTYTL
ncbi:MULTISPECIES: hypothetical protein, partial [unclassified Imperialibacter]|uniref:hypothetical protein n=1 Tax=unclassified Imperialibacter TaxID=2629706 RepID=UPI0019192841